MTTQPMPDSRSLANQFLIAMPNLDDPNFARSVTYICEHNAQGAMGLVINRPIDMALEEVFQQLGLPVRNVAAGRQPVYIGGPVLPDRGFVLHRSQGDWESSMQIAPGMALTTSRDILAALAEGAGPAHWLFALGYAGWSPGQLEEEMSDNAWLSVEADERVLFELPAEARWRAAAELIGIDPSLLSGDSGHA